MTSPILPQLSHCGIYARDVAQMVDFYTKTLGLTVSDRGINSRGIELAFLTAAPGHHHQLVIVSGRSPDGVSTVNQLSFKLGDLDQLKTLFGRVREAGIAPIRQVSHGNALSFYFADPEGNQVEIYIDTPWYIPQPHGVPVDLSRPNEEIMAETEKHCRESAGFLPLDAWQKKVSERLAGG
jgi:catechol 2,3-dioxygenase